MNLFFEQLVKKHDKVSFDSGTRELDVYLKTQASQDIRRFLTSVIVLATAEGRIVGYYTLSQACITVSEFPDRIGKKLPPKRNVPCTLLGRLAVDHRYKGHGYGRALLQHALKKAAKISIEVASYAVIVDAKDMRAKDFYACHGFIELKNQPLRLFIPLAGIREVIDLWQQS